MKCYYHPEKDAVAICKECGKPLCEECAHEFNGKIYCEEDLKKIQEESKKKDEKIGRREERAERREERAERKEERRERHAHRREEREKREEILRDYFPHILLITIAVVAIVIAVLITVFVIPGKHYIIPFNGSNYAITSQYTKEYNSENFLSINGTFGAEDVYIHPTKSVLYRVEGRGDTPTVTYNSGVLTITSEALNNPFLQNLYRRVDIYLNESLTINLSVKEGAGNIYISDTGLNFSDVNIQEGAGNVTINNCDVNSLIINSGVGNVNIGKIKNAGNIRLEGGVGTFNVDLSAITGRSSVVIQNGVGNSTVTVSNQSSVRADVNAISVNSDGFTKTNGYYVNSKYTGSEDIYIKISSVGQVNLKEVNYERP